MARANDKHQDNPVIFDLTDIQKEIHSADVEIRDEQPVMANEDSFTIELNSFEVDISEIIADYNNPDFIDLTELLNAATSDSETSVDPTTQAQEIVDLTLGSELQSDFVTVAEVTFDTTTTPLDIVFNMLDETPSGSDV